MLWSNQVHPAWKSEVIWKIKNYKMQSHALICKSDGGVIIIFIFEY